MNKKQLPLEWVERIFMRLHGRFGNTFFNKFKIGTLNANGEDAGIINAKATWAHELAGVSPDRLKAALDSNYDHAPSCDEFKSNCRIKAVVEDYKALPAPIDREANKVYADNVVQFVAKNTAGKTDFHAWAKRILREPAKFSEDSIKAAKQVLGDIEVAA